MYNNRRTFEKLQYLMQLKNRPFTLSGRQVTIVYFVYLLQTCKSTKPAVFAKCNR